MLFSSFCPGVIDDWSPRPAVKELKQVQSLSKGCKAPWPVELSESTKPYNSWSPGDNIGPDFGTPY
jgi:hypothetical protein